MLENIESVFRDPCRINKEAPIVVGVSGGPDSLCLMESLRQAGYKIIVAHFDHQLRPESKTEAQNVEEIALRLSLPCVVGSGDARAYADAEKLSLEEAARNMRYRFLFDTARKNHAQAVAVGHTADDQVETTLMHFLRGSGLAGLKGMTFVTHLPVFDRDIPIVRPLLNVWREETVSFCGAHDLHPQYDPSNQSMDFLRNRVRASLIPALEAYNPNIRVTIWRAAQTLALDHALLQDYLDEAWNKIRPRVDADFIIMDAARLLECPLGLRRNLIRRAILTLRPNQEIDFALLERASDFAERFAPRLDLKDGLCVFREDDDIILAESREKLPTFQWPQMSKKGEVIAFTFPGSMELGNGWKITSERRAFSESGLEDVRKNADPFQVWLDAEALPDQLELRARRAGDRFAPFGMKGRSQKLTDFFINVKMPQRARDRWPLLCSGDAVIWVVGHRLAHSYQLTQNTRQAAYFAATRVST